MDNQLLAFIASRAANPRLQPLITMHHYQMAADTKVESITFLCNKK